MTAIRHQIMAAAAALLFFCGCEALNAPNSRSRKAAGPVSAAISTDDVLDRCVAAYSRAETIRVSGVFRDNRKDDRRVEPISWEIQRPDRCRVKIGSQEAVVVGNACWDYDTRLRGFREMNIPSRTPMETASYRITRGVSFLLPAILERDEAAFGRSRVRGYVDWRLSGVAWLDDHPCYVLSKKETSSGKDLTRRVWVDQDSYLMRAWDLVQGDGFGRDAVIISETCHEVAVNVPVAAERFKVSVITPEDVKPAQPEEKESEEGQTDGDE